MQSQCTQSAPIVNPETTGCMSPCCPHCSAPVEFAWSECDRCKCAYCPQCGWLWTDGEPCGAIFFDDMDDMPDAM